MSTAASAAERLGSGGKPELDDDDDDEPSELATLLGPGGAGSSAASGALPLLRDRCPAWYGAVMGSHADALSLFCSARYRVPMAVVWFTALGGAMHEPAVPYFYLSLGLSAAQIGQAGGILTAGSLLLAPVYGWLFDKRSAHLALVLAISLCGGGCLLRALATGPGTVLLSAVVMSVDGSFESLVLAYVARDQPVAASGGSRGGGRLTKAAVISAFLVQVQLTRIFGRGETTILSNSFHFPRDKLVPSLSWQIIVFHLKLIIKTVFSGLYPAWNWSVRRLFLLDDSTATGEEEPGVGVGSSQLLRYRIVLASCVVPCVIGFFALLWLCMGRERSGDGGSSRGGGIPVSILKSQRNLSSCCPHLISTSRYQYRRAVGNVNVLCFPLVGGILDLNLTTII